MCQDAAAKSIGTKGDEGYVDNVTFVENVWATTTFPYLDSMNKDFATIKRAVEKENSDLEMVYYGYIDIFSVLGNDLMYAGLSLAVVFVVLIVQTGSLCITCAGLFEIIMSIPLALFVWCVVLGYRGVSNLMFVGFFGTF